MIRMLIASFMLAGSIAALAHKAWVKSGSADRVAGLPCTRPVHPNKQTSASTPQVCALLPAKAIIGSCPPYAMF
jgi:hypothetical protein